MPWLFLVLGLVSALAELHATTFYLSAVSIAAFATALAGLWLPPDWLPPVFAVIALALLPAAVGLRRRLAASHSLPDPDLGQIVTVLDASQGAGRMSVSYRGSRWEAVMETGPPPAPGEVAVITGKTDKLLRLTLLDAARRGR